MLNSIITTSTKQAEKRLQQGGVVAIPTETVYGLAADITQPQAIEKIYQLKQRPNNHPLIVHIAERAMLDQLVTHVPEYAEKLINQFWPGPLTLILPKSALVSDAITADQQNVGIRFPAHPLAIEVIKQLGRPVAAPSANRFGHVSPTTAQHVAEEFADTNLLILDGGRCNIGIESTIADATQPDRYRILRYGMITEQDCESITGITPHGETSSIKAPGLLKSHYAPTKPLHLFKTIEELNELNQQYAQSIYVMAFNSCYFENNLYHFYLKQDPYYVAFHLYFQLRLADQSPCHAIAIELPPATKEWQAIHDRLVRAKSTLE